MKMAGDVVLLVKNIAQGNLQLDRLPAVQLLRPALHQIETCIARQCSGVGLVCEAATLHIDRSARLPLRRPCVLAPQAHRVPRHVGHRVAAVDRVVLVLRIREGIAGRDAQAVRDRARQRSLKTLLDF